MIFQVVMISIRLELPNDHVAANSSTEFGPN